MTSEIVILITELRNKQRITLPAGSYRFGRSAQCEYVLRRNSVGDNQFTVSFENGRWVVTDDGSDYRTWFNNRYLDSGETSVLQSGDVIGLNTDGDVDTQEITFRVEEITNVQGDGAAPIKEQTSDAVLREVDVRRKKRVLIGRGDDCDIKLVSDRVSRHHCEILYKDGHYELHDLGSTNGTYVDGMRRVVTMIGGTAINCFGGPKDEDNTQWPSKITVCAKTGTAQHSSGGSDHGVFVCFAPMDDPQVAIAIFGEKTAHGSSMAPVAEPILKAYFEMVDASEVYTYENGLS